MVKDVLILFNEDARKWSEFILVYLGKEKFHLNISTLSDSNIDLDPENTAFSKVKVIIVILSEGHLNFIRGLDSSCAYERLIQKAGTTVVLFCGIDEKEEEAFDGNQWKDRIPGYSSHIKLTHEKYQELLKITIIKVEDFDRKAAEAEHRHKDTTRSRSTTGKMRSDITTATNRHNKKQGLKFKVIPKTARVEEPTTIAICFDDDQSMSSRQKSAEDNDQNMVDEEEIHADPPPLRISVALGVNDEQLVPAQRVNNSTFIFQSPEHSPGEVPIKLISNGRVIGQTSITYYSFESDLVSSISQIYMFLLDRLLTISKEHEIPAEKLDQSMSDLLEEEHSGSIPPQAFEELFALSIAKGQSEVEYPTLLHLAARYNLFQFGSKLTDLPEANAACNLRNRQGQTPGEMARTKGHAEMVELFETFGEQKETIGSMYATTKPPPDAENENEEDPYMIFRENEPGLEAIVYEDLQLLNLSSGDEMHDPKAHLRLDDNTTIGSVASSSSSSSVDHGQEELVRIQQQVKSQQMSIREAEILFKEWQLRHSGSSSANCDGFRQSGPQQLTQVNKLTKPKSSFFAGKLLKKSAAQQSKTKGMISSPSLPYTSDHPQTLQSPLQTQSLNHLEKTSYSFSSSSSSSYSSSSSSTRSSTTSSSSRDSCVSKMSYLSGIETIDDEDEDEDATYDVLQTIAKRNSSAILEQLEEDLRNPASQKPPPLPYPRSLELERALPSTPRPKPTVRKCSSVDVSHSPDDEHDYIQMNSPVFGYNSTTTSARSQGVIPPKVAPKTRKLSCPSETTFVQQKLQNSTVNQLSVSEEPTRSAFDPTDPSPQSDRDVSSGNKSAPHKKNSLPALYGSKEKPLPPPKKLR